MLMFVMLCQMQPDADPHQDSGNCQWQGDPFAQSKANTTPKKGAIEK